MVDFAFQFIAVGAFIGLGVFFVYIFGAMFLIPYYCLEELFKKYFKYKRDGGDDDIPPGAVTT
jgi:hypothetical protein